MFWAFFIIMCLCVYYVAVVCCFCVPALVVADLGLFVCLLCWFVFCVYVSIVVSVCVFSLCVCLCMCSCLRLCD